MALAGEQLVCGGTNEPCENAMSCLRVSGALLGAIPYIQREVTTHEPSADEAWESLESQVLTAGRILKIELYPARDEHGNVSVCPKDALEGEYSRYSTAESAVTSLRRFMNACVENATTHLNRKGSGS